MCGRARLGLPLGVVSRMHGSLSPFAEIGLNTDASSGVRDELVDREVSIGDYVLTNGTVAAAVMLDCVSRFVQGFLGDEKSLTEESFMTTLLGFPQYTRPPDFRGLRVPEVLLSGNHAAIAQWRREQQIEKTRKIRPDLLQDNGESQQ